MEWILVINDPYRRYPSASGLKLKVNYNDDERLTINVLELHDFTSSITYVSMFDLDSEEDFEECQKWLRHLNYGFGLLLENDIEQSNGCSMTCTVHFSETLSIDVVLRYRIGMLPTVTINSINSNGVSFNGTLTCGHIGKSFNILSKAVSTEFLFWLGKIVDYELEHNILVEQMKNSCIITN